MEHQGQGKEASWEEETPAKVVNLVREEESLEAGATVRDKDSQNIIESIFDFETYKGDSNGL